MNNKPDIDKLALEIAKDLRDSVDGMVHGYVCTSQEALAMLTQTVRQHLAQALEGQRPL